MELGTFRIKLADVSLVMLSHQKVENRTLEHKGPRRDSETYMEICEIEL